jgi:hypothetical protein
MPPADQSFEAGGSTVNSHLRLIVKEELSRNPDVQFMLKEVEGLPKSTR